MIRQSDAASRTSMEESCTLKDGDKAAVGLSCQGARGHSPARWSLARIGDAERALRERRFIGTAGQAAQSAARETGARKPGSRPDCRAGRARAPPPCRPCISGLPGRMAICQKPSGTPRSASTGLHQVMVADRSAAERDKNVGAPSQTPWPQLPDQHRDRSGAMPRSMTSAPASRANAATPKPFEATIWSGPGARRAAPVRRRSARMATRGWRTTRTALDGRRPPRATRRPASSSVPCAEEQSAFGEIEPARDGYGGRRRLARQS